MEKPSKTKKTAAKKGEKALDPKEAKLNALTQALNNIEKDYGRGAVMKLGDEVVEKVDVIPSGSIGLNFALGVGGYPKGRIIEIYGPESSGKTTLALHAIAEAQKAGGIAAMIDAEHAFDRFYAEKLGVDVTNLLISQPDNGEQALEIAEQLIRSAAIDILVVDSVAALTPKSEIEGDMGDRNVGLQARLMSQAMRKLTGTIARTNTVCIFINQLREKIGQMFGNHYRRKRAEILCFRARGYPSRHFPEGRGQCPGKTRQGENCEEQGRSPLQALRVRHHVRRGHLEGERNNRPRSRAGYNCQERFLVQL